jgi:hypothetical protein
LANAFVGLRHFHFVITRGRAFARGIRVTHFPSWAKLGRPHEAGDFGCLRTRAPGATFSLAIKLTPQDA